MNERQQNLSRALAKHPAFKPCRGMTGVRDAPGKSDNLRPELIVWGKGSEADFTAFGCLPDLCDPATVGALAGLIRSKSDDILTCQYDEEGWFIDAYGYRETSSYPTEGEAWANLLLSVKL